MSSHSLFNTNVTLCINMSRMMNISVEEVTKLQSGDR